MAVELEVRFSTGTGGTDLAGAACRKCGASATGPACPRCGLARDRAGAWETAHPRVAAELVAAWRATQAAWDDAAAHDRVAALALRSEALPWLAARYRELERARPDDAVVRARLERIVTMTLAALRATETPRRVGGARKVGFAVMCALVLLVAGAIVTAGRSSAQGSGRRRPAVGAIDPDLRVHRALVPDGEGQVFRPANPRR